MENQPKEEEQPVTYAGFGKRMAALLMDRVLLSVVTFFVYIEIHREVARIIQKNGRILSKMYKSSDLDKYDRADNISYLVMSVFMALVLWGYYAGMESSPFKGTLGKKLMGLEVTDEQGERISFTKASGRYFAKIISIMVFCIGYLAMLFNDKKQTWHDKMSGCIVKEK
jgi:uncharacterized RDD family membrane protein YckC